MKLRNKLLLYFFNISILILIVGMIFYFQLKNLVEPLTPQSIPLSVQQLENVIDRNDIMHRLMYQQLLVEHNLENYVFTNNNISLQAYYMNNSIITQLLDRARNINPPQLPLLENVYHSIGVQRAKIINLMQTNQAVLAKQQIIDAGYIKAIEDFKIELSHYFDQPNATSNETAVVTVKLATKNAHNILQKSLNSTLIIFFDAMLISLILVFFSSKSIVQPINLLRNNIEQMGKDKIVIKINPILLRLNSEVGDLARSFSELLNKLSAATVLRDELLMEIKRHKETELQLEETAARLKQSNLDLDQFAYAASHDLRSPLQAIQNLAQWVVEDCYQLLPEESKKNLDLIIKRVHRLDALVTKMLEYSRVSHITQDLERIDLNILVSDIVEDLSPPPHIKIVIDTSLPVLLTEKAKITQVFLNLISNAIKYNDKQKGFINIGHKVITHYHQFYVSDNGCGIDLQYHQKIFEIFQTLQSRDTIEGSGIGLAIVKKIIEKVGGKIWLTSIIRQGTTFYFNWPIS